MRKFISVMALLLTLTLGAAAMSYDQARQQALFLTDKMAYELNLTDDQYNAAYEINLDYLMSVNTYDDLYGAYWRYRNTDLSYVLLDWQYRAYVAASYFYRPLYFSDGFWHFGIYARYPHRDYFYFYRPTVYVSYHGGHSWYRNGGRSWYNGRNYGPRPGNTHFGMRDGFNRGDFGNGNRQSFGSRQPANIQPNNNTNRGTFGSRGTRQSSTRTTVNQPNGTTGNSSSFGSRRSGTTTSPTTRPNSGMTVETAPRSTFGGARGNGTPSFGGSSRSNSSSFGGGSRSNSPSFGGSSSFGGGSRGGSSSSNRGSFGSRR